MPKVALKNFDIISFALTSAFVGAFAGLLFALLVVASGLGALLALAGNAGLLAGFGVFSIILFPIIFFIINFVSGIILALILNLVFKITKGLKLDLEELE